MAAFYWSNGQATGSSQTMLLTIVGEVSVLQVTSSALSGNQPVGFQNFQRCIQQSQTIVCGPVPLSFLPLTAKGFGCVPTGQIEPIVPQATSASPTDPHPTGPNPFCDALTAGGTVLTIGGSGGSPPTPQQLCDAAQSSSALSRARSAFVAACAALRSDQANVTAYAGVAAAAAALAAVLITVALTEGNYIVAIVLAVLAGIMAAIALVFSLLSANAALDVGLQQSLLDSAQRSWESAVAAVRTACCPAWITINTADLVCP